MDVAAAALQMMLVPIVWDAARASELGLVKLMQEREGNA